MINCFQMSGQKMKIGLVINPISSHRNPARNDVSIMAIYAYELLFKFRCVFATQETCLGFLNF